MASSHTTRILDWLRAGYPDGVPAQDFPPVLGVLHRILTDEDIESVADQLALQSISNGVEPIGADEIREMVRRHAFQSVTPEDLRRVSSQLASGGWPLATDLP